MKKLVIVAEVPDNWAAAMEYGTGLLEEWAEEALGATLEGDFTEGEWAKDVERLYGVKWDGARDAFNVIEARFVEGDEAEEAQAESETAYCGGGV